jgi:hypothetical protein
MHRSLTEILLAAKMALWRMPQETTGTDRHSCADQGSRYSAGCTRHCRATAHHESHESTIHGSESPAEYHADFQAIGQALG